MIIIFPSSKFINAMFFSPKYASRTRITKTLPKTVFSLLNTVFRIRIRPDLLQISPENCHKKTKKKTYISIFLVYMFVYVLKGLFEGFNHYQDNLIFV